MRRLRNGQTSARPARSQLGIDEEYIPELGERGIGSIDINSDQRATTNWQKYEIMNNS